MAQRLQAVYDHLKQAVVAPSSTNASSDSDVVVITAKRTALCKSKKGQYKDTTSDELLLGLFKSAKASLPIDVAHIQDICVGTVLTKNAPYSARAAALTAGFSEKTGMNIVNRFCSSGLMAVSVISNQIRNGEIDCGLAVGFEHMTANPDGGAAKFESEEMNSTQLAKDCLNPMGWTSENVAGDFNISRERMDEFAAMSHNRAEKAQEAGYFKNEIVPVEAFTKDSEGNRKKVTVTEDDGIRKGTSKESLLKIKSAFPQWKPSNTTGGNASQITDGGAFVLLMSRQKANSLGLTPIARHITTAVTGLSPRIMGIGPVFAIPKALNQAGIKQEDVDLWEINEAFASMFVYSVEKLGLDKEKVNVNGGAIAFGHPLGATGARQVATGLNELKRRGGKILVTSMCIGLGQGAAAVWIAE